MTGVTFRKLHSISHKFSLPVCCREDVGKISEPKAQAIFETTAEVLNGLIHAYDHYNSGSEPAQQLFHLLRLLKGAWPKAKLIDPELFLMRQSSVEAQKPRRLVAPFGPDTRSPQARSAASIGRVALMRRESR